MRQSGAGAARAPRASARRRRGLLGGVALGAAAGALGCAGAPPPNHTPASLRAQFARVYNGLAAEGRRVERGPYRYERALFQQGMPRADGARVAWFFRAAGDRSGGGPAVWLGALPCERAAGVACRYVPLGFPSAADSRVGLVEVRAGEGAPAGYRPGDDWRVRLVAPGGEAVELELRRPPGPDGAFNFVAYSCNRPYHRGHDGDRVRAANVNSLNQFRILTETEAGRPAFSLGLGDQLYLDPDPEAERGFSLFSGNDSDAPRFADRDVDALIEEAYRAHFALPPFDRALRAVPSAMMWDDHELRDGAGVREGDGCGVGAGCGGRFAHYYARARAAFEAFQASRNPPPGAGRADPDLDVAFSWGRWADIFLLDLRSSRSADRKTIAAPAQLARLGAWLERAAREHAGREHLLVIGSASPLIEGLLAGPAPPKPGQKDEPELGDSWGSVSFYEARREVFGRLQAHFLQNPAHRLLVLSGDVHESGLAWLGLRGPWGQRVFGHEIVSSGIANTRASGASNLRLGEVGAELGSAGGLVAWAGGVVKSAPAFAQVFVEPGPPLRVGFTLHVSGAPGGPPWWKFWSTPYDEAPLADYAPALAPRLARPPLVPRWGAFRGAGVGPGAGLVRVPLPVGALPGAGGCPSKHESADWPEDPCGRGPFEAARRGEGGDGKGPPGGAWRLGGGRAGLHEHAIWGVARRRGEAVRQAEFATDWLEVFAGERLEVGPP